MPHQCVKCQRILPVASKELLEGCANCKSKFFFYVKEEMLEKVKTKILEIPVEEKTQIEKDVREIAGIEDEDTPVILDFESVRSTGSGKFEIDLSKAFDKKRPFVFKLEEGKYMIDIGRTLKDSLEKKEE